MAIKFKFNHRKTAEAILYIATKAKNPTIMSVCKLLYFADKTHLQKYGRFLTGDFYVAMKHGPVPSNAYDMLKASRDTNAYGFTVDYFDVIPDRDVKEDEFSKSDLKVLDSVIESYGDLPAWDLSQKSHDEAFNRVWENSHSNNAKIPVEYILEALGFVEDEMEDILDYLQLHYEEC